MGESFKVQDHMTKFKAGDRITWTSGAAGTQKAKTGEVLGVLIGDESPDDGFRRIMPKGTPMPAALERARSFGGWSARYLIEVRPPGKKRPGAKRGYADPAPVYYAPLVRVIDGASSSAGKLVKAAGR